MNQFKVSREYQESMQTKRAALYRDSYLDFPVLYCNFFVAEQFMGRYCISEISRKIQPGDYQILDYVNQMTQQAYRSGKIYLVNQTKEIEILLIAAIEEKTEDEERFYARMKVFQWMPEDSYVCVAIPLNERDIQTHTAISTRLDLERQYPGNIILSNTGTITSV